MILYIYSLFPILDVVKKRGHIGRRAIQDRVAFLHREACLRLENKQRVAPASFCGEKHFQSTPR